MIHKTNTPRSFRIKTKNASKIRKNNGHIKKRLTNSKLEQTRRLSRNAYKNLSENASENNNQNLQCRHWLIPFIQDRHQE